MATPTVEDLLSASIIGYWHADDLSGDGTGVASWEDRVNGLEFLQASGPDQPTWRANYASSGYAGVEFDGGDEMLVDDATLSLADGFQAIFCVTRGTGSNETPIVFGDATTYLRLQFGTATVAHQGTASFSPSLAISNQAISERRVYVWRYASGQSRLQAAVDAAGSLVTGTELADTTWQIGSRWGALGFTGAFHALVIATLDCGWYEALAAARVMREDWGITRDTDPLPVAAAGGVLGFPRRLA